jgi:hypothetical protein
MYSGMIGLDSRGSRVRFSTGLRIFIFAAVSVSVPRSRMREAIPPFPQYVFMARCLVKHRHSGMMIRKYYLQGAESLYCFPQLFKLFHVFYGMKRHAGLEA